MEVGDSFAVPLEGESSSRGMDTAADKLRCAALNHGRRYGGKFVVRTVREENVARCWRVE